MGKRYFVFTWAYCIIIGCLMITPAGKIWINVNPVNPVIVGATLVLFNLVAMVKYYKANSSSKAE